MKKPVLILLVLLVSIFTAGSVSAISMGYYSQGIMNLWETAFPQTQFEPGELAPGEYRLHLNTGKFNSTYLYEDLFSEETDEERFDAHNFFGGLDIALNESWYLSLGYNMLPEYTVSEDETWEGEPRKSTAKADLFNARLTYLLSESTRLFGGYARSNQQMLRYYDGDLRYKDTDTTDYLYLGAEFYGSILK